MKPRAGGHGHIGPTKPREVKQNKSDGKGTTKAKKTVPLLAVLMVA